MKKTLVLVCLFVSLVMQAKQTRNLLTGAYTKQDIAQYLVKDDSWVSFPAYADRAAWNKIAPEFRAQYIAEGEKYLGYDWPTVKATLYLEYVRSGDREGMQAVHNARVKALESLVMAELVEGKGRFMDDLVNGVYSFSEQTYWGLSAHLPLQKRGAGLPDVNDPTIDLGVGRVAADLSWTYYFFKQAFDKINPLIAERLKQEITNKVLTPYYTRTDIGWMGYKGGLVNNWNPWCNYNVLNCILLIEDNQQKKIDNVYKTMQSVDHFINYYGDDGGCDEGPSYWGEAGGKLYEYLDVLQRSTQSKVSIFNSPLVKNMGAYIYKVYIDDVYFINFADATAQLVPDANLIYNFGKHIQDPKMMGFGAYLAQKNNPGTKIFTGKLELALENLFSMDEIQHAKAEEPHLGQFYLPNVEVAGVRDTEGSAKGFYFAAKGGFNNESHNHNDVGSCIMYYNGLPVLLDVGVGTYSRKTFSKDRYTIWTMQSGYHNLPVINGVEQHYGSQYKAKGVSYSNSKTTAKFQLDISQAYPKEALVNQWIRSYELIKGKRFIIKDRYNLQENNGKNLLHFMTTLSCQEIKKGMIEMTGKGIKLRMKYNPKVVSFAIEDRKLEDPRLIKAWPQGVIRRITFTILAKTKEGENTIEIIPIK